VAAVGSGEIVVLSDIVPDGSYVVTLQITKDRAVTLDRHQAVQYALGVVAAAEAADHDAAVFRQAKAMNADESVAASLVLGLRDQRSTPDEATAPLRFAPIINAKRRPIVQITLDGQPFGSLTPTDARSHGLDVLRMVAVAELDESFTCPHTAAAWALFAAGLLAPDHQPAVPGLDGG
jgi:hypothetical protein